MIMLITLVRGGIAGRLVVDDTASTIARDGVAVAPPIVIGHLLEQIQYVKISAIFTHLPEQREFIGEAAFDT
jgi:hypothetical protein